MLSQYEKDIIAIPQLSVAETNELIARYMAGDLTAEDALITGNMRLVLKIALGFKYTFSKVMRSEVIIEDLISIGVVGLINGIRSYDPQINSKFGSYLCCTIERTFINYLRDLRCPKRNCGADISLQETVSSTEGLTLEDVIADPKPIDNIFDLNSLRLDLASLFPYLSAREQIILALHYGLVDGNCYSRSRICAILAKNGSKVKSPERIRQLENQALAVVRRKGQDRLIEYL